MWQALGEGMFGEWWRAIAWVVLVWEFEGRACGRNKNGVLIMLRCPRGAGEQCFVPLDADAKHSLPAEHARLDLLQSTNLVLYNIHVTSGFLVVILYSRLF